MHETPQGPDRDRAASFGQALDEVLLAFSAESNVRREELLARHPELGVEVDAVIDLAREIAVVRPQVLPSIPGYEILGEVGRGGMGVVYRARQHGVDRVVALKVLPEAFGVDARGRTRFLAEARGLGRIRHDHVVTIHGVVETSDVVAYAMEWVDGRSLASLLEELAGWSRRGEVPIVRFGGEISAQLPNPPVPWFCRLGIALGRALGEVHRHGLVHRDVKPGNVLLRSDGTPLLSDFGLVRAESVRLTRTGQVVGTPAFAAPEQLRGDGEGVGPWSDVFALGATLHCALAGQVPFAGRTPMELLTNIEARRRRSLTELGLPRDLETIIARCVEPEARDRYASAVAVADDLENLLALRPVQARPLGAMARGWRLVRRNRSLVLAGVVSGLVVLAACVLLALWIWNRLTLPERFEKALLAARTTLLEPTHEERVELAGMGRGPGRSSMFELTGSNALVAYDDVLRLDGSRIDAVLERDVVALALQMVRREAPKPSAALRAMAPQACAAAVDWHAGSEFDSREIDGAIDTDRRASGLLAFLTGHATVCHEAWGPLELAGDPFIDAAAGQMHLQRGEVGKAYSRLSRAALVWPQAGFLAVAVADCAVREGDLAVAARELDRADKLGLKDPFETHVRVKADLRAAQGRVAEARELYEWMIVHHKGNTARAHYAVMLERVGDRGRLLDLKLDRFESGADSDAEEVANAAWRWWTSLSLSDRIEECSVLFSGRTGSRLGRLASFHSGRRSDSDESRTAATTPASGKLHEATKGLAFLMELTQMNHPRQDTRQNLPAFARQAISRAIGTLSGIDPSRSPLRAALAQMTSRACWVATMLVACLANAQTFSDGTFSGWQGQVFLNPLSSVSWSFPPTSGNPGPCVQVSSALVGTTSTDLALVGLWATAHTWDPATMGPIKTVATTVQASVLSTNGQAVYPFVEQGGRFFYATGQVCTSSLWQTMTFPPAGANQFGEIAPPVIQVPSNHPDFSASGGPIHFGFLVGNGPGLGSYAATTAHDNWTVTVTPAGLFSTWGSGCPGTNGTPAIGHENLPGLGFQNFRITVQNAPPGFAALVLSTSMQTLPGAVFGAPGCDLHIGFNHVQVETTITAGQYSSRVPIPNVPSLINFTFHSQWLVYDPPANAFGLTTSNAATATIE